MSRILKLGWLLVFASFLIATTSFSQEAKGPTFTAKDRELIEGYYRNIIGTLAPGSLNRSSYPPEVERMLVAGGHVPMSVENELERLPDKLETQLSQIARSNNCYRLGRHVILVRKEDGVITDILKNVALNPTHK
jgi:hypothetical protein